MGVLRLNERLLPVYQKHKPIKVIIGGRNSGKSVGVSDILTLKMASEAANIYCLREYQDSVYDSVHRVMSESVTDRLQLTDWDIQKSTIVAPNGKKTTYKGANRNPDSMQSAHGYKYSWFEEANRASQASIDKLLPTILRNPGAECIFTANPQSSADPFSKRFIVPYLDQVRETGYYEDDLHMIIQINWRHNPWFDAAANMLRLHDKEKLSRAKYDWIWEGEFFDSVDDSIIEVEWFNACIDAHVKLGLKAEGQRRVAYDPADSGDAKAVADMHGSVLVDCVESVEGDVNTATDWATSYASQVGAQVFTYDSVGIGLSLRRQISNAFTGRPVSIVAFNGGSEPESPNAIYEKIDVDAELKGSLTNKELFQNGRAQRYFNLRNRIYNTYLAVTKGVYIDPAKMLSISSSIKDMDKLRAEICRIPRDMGARKFKIKTKSEMLNLGIASPNMADSVMMCATDVVVNKPQIACDLAPIMRRF